MTKPGIIIGLLAAWALVPAVDAAAQTTPINETCPVMEGEPIDPAITTVYQGQTIAFCCDRCQKKFAKDPGRYLKNLPQFVAIAAEAGDAHESADGDDESMPFAGRIHPLLVHFPIAGLPLALLGLIAWLATGKEAFSRADAPPLIAAALVSIAAVITGHVAADASRFSSRMQAIVEQHETASTAVMILALVLSALRIWRWNRLGGVWLWAYGVGLVVTCTLVGITGFLGGSLVFGPEHLKF